MINIVRLRISKCITSKQFHSKETTTLINPENETTTNSKKEIFLDVKTINIATTYGIRSTNV